MVNQTLDGLSYEIRLYHQSGVQYTNLLCADLFDVTHIYRMYVDELNYMGVQVWHKGENITDRVAATKFARVSMPAPKKQSKGVACIYVLKENGKEVCRGGLEKCKDIMYKLGKADMEGAGDKPYNVTHGEDYYNRVEAETLKTYSLKIEPVDQSGSN